jgi:myosin-1
MTTAQVEQLGVDDLVLLPKVNEQGIVDNLRKRYLIDKIYTNIGPVLISVNPFMYIKGLCDNENVEEYKGRFRYEVPPNIFALAEDAYRKMKNETENQCVIITGESGAGKTEAAKLIMKYIAAVSSNAAEISYVKDVIMDSNPLLESFGNAKTLRNNNSSRFGKYFEVQFNRYGDPCGGKISHYLLEKSRVVSRLKQERCFHIFYQLLKGADHTLREQFGLRQPQDYKYLNCSECYEVPGTDDVAEFNDTRKAFNTLSFSNDEQYYILRLLAGILAFGNLDFADDNTDKATFPKGEEPLNTAAQLFQIDPTVLKGAITLRTVQTKGSTYKVPNNALNARESRDALCKEIYTRTFDFLIDKTNIALNKYGAQFTVVIGVLDIYGFEIFDRNGFEQFCINYVNEKLQQYFIELTLKAEQEEYKREGIQWSDIKYFNNKIVCDLIEGKQPPGIFSLLDDVCNAIFAVGTSGGIDAKFLDKCAMFCSENLHFYKKGTAFAIKHYAGEVTYETEGFCDRNKDAIWSDIVQAVQVSANPFLVARFPEDVSGKFKQRPTTAGYKIKTSCGELMKTLSACNPHYVRCIKPNDTKKAKDWDEKRVAHQVQYLGLLENVRVRRAGFAYRAEYHRFLNRYKKLNIKTWGSWGEWTGDPKQGCTIILQESALDVKQWQLGATKIFIRYPESLFYLEECLERHDYDAAMKIQKVYRMWVAKKHSLEQRAAASNLLKGKKDRRNESNNPQFVGDYMSFDKNYGLQEALGPHKDERVVFADQIIKINRRMKPERRDLIVSVEALTLVMRTKKLNKEWYKVVKRVPLTHIQTCSLSALKDNFVVIHCQNATDLLIECTHKTEMLAVMLEYYQKLTNRQFALEFNNNLQYVVSGDTRQLNFQSDGSAQRAKLKKTGKVLNISIAPGIGKDADTAPKLNLTQHIKPAQNFVKPAAAQQPVQHHAPAAGPTHGGGGGIQAPAGIGGIAAAIQNKQVGAGQPQPPPPKVQQPPAQPAKPMAKALYPYTGATPEELSFQENDMIAILKKDPGGWWEGELRGKRGWIPANYVQEQ